MTLGGLEGSWAASNSKRIFRRTAATVRPVNNYVITTLNASNTSASHFLSIPRVSENARKVLFTMILKNLWYGGILAEASCKAEMCYANTRRVCITLEGYKTTRAQLSSTAGHILEIGSQQICTKSTHLILRGTQKIFQQLQHTISRKCGKPWSWYLVVL